MRRSLPALPPGPSAAGAQHHPCWPVRLARGSRRSVVSSLIPAGLTLTLAIKGCWPGLPGLSCPLRALTGIPCPTCFLTRATSAALCGDLAGSIQLHAFGPPAAATLLVWSVVAIRQGRLVPRQLPAWPLGLTALALMLYWLLRMGLRYGLGWQGFPAFPSG